MASLSATVNVGKLINFAERIKFDSSFLGNPVDYVTCRASCAVQCEVGIVFSGVCPPSVMISVCHCLSCVTPRNLRSGN